MIVIILKFNFAVIREHDLYNSKFFEMYWLFDQCVVSINNVPYLSENEYPLIVVLYSSDK